MQAAKRLPTNISLPPSHRSSYRHCCSRCPHRLRSVSTTNTATTTTAGSIGGPAVVPVRLGCDGTGTSLKPLLFIWMFSETAADTLL